MKLKTNYPKLDAVVLNVFDYLFLISVTKVTTSVWQNIYLFLIFCY